MYFLYLDDAGSPENINERYVVIAGICVFERQISWLNTYLDQVVYSTEHPEPDTLELHGSHILAGRKFWRKQSFQERRRVIRHGLAAFHSLRGTWCLFSAVVDKHVRSPEDPQEYAFEQVVTRFDHFLRRRYQRGHGNDKGLIVMDENKNSERLRTLSENFRFQGHRWGKQLQNIADVPLFVDSKATRSIQAADLTAYAVWRYMEKHDSEFFDVIKNDFDQSGGVVHGFFMTE